MHFGGIPLVVSCKEGLQREARGFRIGQLAPRRRIRTRARRMILSIERSGQRRLAVVFPLVPALRHNLRSHFSIQENYGGVRAPRTAEIYLGRALLRRESAVVEDVAALLFRVMLALCREIDQRVRERVDLAAIEKRDRVAEDEIDVAFDVALGEILARRLARAPIAVAVLAVGVERVLIPEESDAAE